MTDHSTKLQGLVRNLAQNSYFIYSVQSTSQDKSNVAKRLKYQMIGLEHQHGRRLLFRDQHGRRSINHPKRPLSRRRHFSTTSRIHFVFAFLFNFVNPA